MMFGHAVSLKSYSSKRRFNSNTTNEYFKGAITKVKRPIVWQREAEEALRTVNRY